MKAKRKTKVIEKEYIVLKLNIYDTENCVVGLKYLLANQKEPLGSEVIHTLGKLRDKLDNCLDNSLLG